MSDATTPRGATTTRTAAAVRLTTLATPRLLLRRFRAGDAAELAGYRSDPAVARYQSWSAPVSGAQAAALVNAFAAGDPRQPGWFQYAIEHTADRHLVGDLGVGAAR